MFNCIVCNKIIPKENWYRKPKCCCRECYIIYHKQKTEIVKCLYCKNEFIKNVNIKKIYCSIDCRYKATQKNGHIYTSGNGYKYIKINKKYILLHRYLIEQKIGRKLKKGEITHHVNKNKLDNNINNLYLFERQSEHSKLHYKTERINSPESIQKRIFTRWGK